MLPTTLFHLTSALPSPVMACTLFARDRQQHTYRLPPTCRTMWRRLRGNAVHRQTGCRCKASRQHFCIPQTAVMYDYFVLCLLSSSRPLLSSSHFERGWVQRAIDAACITVCSSLSLPKWRNTILHFCSMFLSFVFGIRKQMLCIRMMPL